MAEKKTCFVVMGFGTKVDFQSGRKLNLDAAYRTMIKPAVEEAGLVCRRADEIAHSGNINVPMYREILTAEVVVADLSTSSANAFYELGVRHALRQVAKGKARRASTPGLSSFWSAAAYSTVTDLARLRGWSTSQPRRTAMW